jgi:DNA/RNA-binding domain of Phe-tRNA-synthetase-like protein
MLNISGTDDWRAAHPGAVIGFLEVSRVENNRASSSLFAARKRETESRLRALYKDFSRQDFLSIPAMAAYQKYYKKFSKTYHVLLQLESLVLKGKSLPDVSPLVDANFTAEVETLALTAGHDVAKLSGPILMDVARAGDQFTQMGGAVKSALVGDMVMRDEQGLCCSIIHGQDDRSPITAETTHALYVVYAPAGVPLEAVEGQLQKIEDNIRLFSPTAVTEQSRLLAA